MGLNESKGNMYDFVTHTWNVIKGECPHDCSYCYMKRWNNLKPVRFDEKELETNLGNCNFIFVGSSCDMFALDIPKIWIKDILNHCVCFHNKYLFQSKNPAAFLYWSFPSKSIFCTTIETNRYYQAIMRNSPKPEDRATAMMEIEGVEKYITIEPIMDFDTDEFFEMIYMCEPLQVNIGADSGNNKLPEPSHDKIDALIEELNAFTTVKLKANLKRLYEKA